MDFPTRSLGRCEEGLLSKEMGLSRASSTSEYTHFSHRDFAHEEVGGLEEFPGVDDLGQVVDRLADAGGEGEAQVRVNVDLGDAVPDCSLNVRVQNTTGLSELRAVFLRELFHVFEHAGGTVEHDGERH